ncbi:MAG: histidine phosphatase family protein [Deltaproteobacteria bacterium]|nr:histidine phosphatase family protein [Deltaproteobacteria bacterium]
MESTIYLIRHGAVEEPYRNRFIGSTDAPLSADGSEQILKVRDFVRTAAPIPPSAVYCSRLQRSVASALILAEPWGLAPELVGELNEIDFGQWENLTYCEIEERSAGDLERWLKNPFHEHPPGGEMLSEVRKRAVAAFERIRGAHDGGTVIVVAHGGVNRVLLCHIMGIPEAGIFHLDQDYAAVNIIRYFDGFPVLKLLNGVMR